MSQGRRASFPGNQPAIYLDNRNIVSMDARCFAVHANGVCEIIVDLTSWSRPSSASWFALLLQDHICQMGA